MKRYLVWIATGRATFLDSKKEIFEAENDNEALKKAEEITKNIKHIFKCAMDDITDPSNPHWIAEKIREEFAWHLIGTECVRYCELKK